MWLRYLYPSERKKLKQALENIETTEQTLQLIFSDLISYDLNSFDGNDNFIIACRELASLDIQKYLPSIDGKLFFDETNKETRHFLNSLAYYIRK